MQNTNNSLEINSNFFYRAAFLLFFIPLMAAAGIFSGCNLDTSPVPKQVMGATEIKPEYFSLDFDGRGYINGVFFPPWDQNKMEYPISYVGSWTTVPSLREYKNYTRFMLVSSNPGDYVQVVGTFSRVVFGFHLGEMVRDVGVVNFDIDGKPLETFSLDKIDSNGERILDCVINTGKLTVATITMKVERGTVAIANYLLVLYHPTLVK
ncbi:MAG: hypothetical protein HQM10_07185 [Candidatus Riflebacteria bacterium]|nr:hypothetical protein [Candidatus Riflebacteria bacterium]